MDPSDLIVLAAITHPIGEALDLIKWYVRAHPDEMTSPSMLWWIKKYAVQVMAYAGAYNVR